MRTTAAQVTLREITSETVASIIKLSVAPGQERFVMLADDSPLEPPPQPPAWRIGGVGADVEVSPG